MFFSEWMGGRRARRKCKLRKIGRKGRRGRKERNEKYGGRKQRTEAEK